MNKLIFPILIVLSLPLIFQSTPTEILKLKVFDAFVTTPEPSGNFVVLGYSFEVSPTQARDNDRTNTTTTPRGYNSINIILRRILSLL